MAILTIFTVILSILSSVLIYGLYNSLKKIEAYEDAVAEYEEAIQQFYERTSVTLHTMRAIDDRELFEKDDDVGATFQMLVDTLNELKPLIYGIRDGEEEDE